MEKPSHKKLKTELCQPRVERKCCAVAGPTAFCCMRTAFRQREIRITTASDELAARLPHLMRRAFGIDFDEPEKGRGVKHLFRVNDPDKLRAVFDVVGNDMNSPSLHINFGVIEEPCCKASFIRGAFRRRLGDRPGKALSHGACHDALQRKPRDILGAA